MGAVGREGGERRRTDDEKQPVDVDADLQQDDAEDAGQQTEGQHDQARDEQRLPATGLWPDVRPTRAH